MNQADCDCCQTCRPLLAASAELRALLTYCNSKLVCLRGLAEGDACSVESVGACSVGTVEAGSIGAQQHCQAASCMQGL